MRMLADGPLPHLPGFLNSLVGPLDHLGYWAVLLFVMIEDFGVPVPGETIPIAAAVDAGAGRLNALDLDHGARPRQPARPADRGCRRHRHPLVLRSAICSPSRSTLLPS